MRTLHLPAAAGPFERGLFHGRTLAREIAEIAAIRSELAQSQGLFRSDEELLAVAERHLPVLEGFDGALHQELLGIAEGAGLPPARIVVLNHYTDLKDLDPTTVLGGARRGPDPERDDECTAIAAGTPEGAILGQTWDMHGSAAPYVTMLHVPAWDDRPEAWLLSIAGCLGMAGMNAAGVGVTINNLKSSDARVGLVWPALVRRVLAETSAEAGRDIVLSAPLGSGHHYAIADARRAFGIETSGRLVEVWSELDVSRPGGAFHHENHCVGTQVARVSSIGQTSTTLERSEALDASLRARPIESGADLWARLGSHEGHPRSVCTHLTTAELPHAMLTCAGVLMNLTTRRMWAAPGCIFGVVPEELLFDVS
ncbi:MAG: C45 family peptidase [Myxococcota bacterium]|nr:C45 family peptidase [Myxococcota bacterium]